MREIIFRGKRMSPYTKEWIEGSLIQVFAEGNVYTKIYTEDHVADPFGKKYWDIEPYEGNLLDVYPDTVGQYTDETDKNGRKIFEGDFLVDSFRDKFLVSYGGKGGYLIFGSGVVHHYAGCDLSDFEIIGNIHDNPELLEEIEYPSFWRNER